MDAFYFVNNVVVYKAPLVKKKEWQGCLQNIYCKCSIYAFVSNLTILTFSKAMDQDLLGAYGLSYSKWGISLNGGKSPEVGGLRTLSLVLVYQSRKSMLREMHFSRFCNKSWKLPKILKYTLF